MTTASYSELRANLAKFLDKAELDCEEIVVNRGKGRKVIIVSLDDYLSLQETAYLLSSTKNRKHLEASLQQAKKGKTVRVTF
jgi:antitoxin YefM